MHASCEASILHADGDTYSAIYLLSSCASPTRALHMPVLFYQRVVQGSAMPAKRFIVRCDNELQEVDSAYQLSEQLRRARISPGCAVVL